MRTLLVATLGCSSLWAGEYAVLTTGFRIRAERHSADGPTTTLYDSNGGSAEIPTAAIAGFEVDDYVPPPPPSPPEPPAAQPADIASLVQEAAQRHGVTPELVHSVIAAESGYDPKAVSPKGALGLMQLMPSTARDLNVSDAFDPAQNINGGTAYLRQMLDRYAGSVKQALAAYNAGPGKVDLYGGLPPYRETIQFVSRVLARLKK